MRKVLNFKTIFVMFTVVMIALAFSTNSVFAKPPGDSRDADVGKKLWGFNVLAVPQDNWSQSDTTCYNNGNRIFFERVNSGAIGTIQWAFDPLANNNFKIADCDGTNDGTAKVIVNESLSVYVMIRILGKKTDSLTLTCTEIFDYVGTDDLCLIDTETFNKGNSFTKIMENVFDNEYEEVLWTLETSTGFRHAQVWVFEKL
jgi:hypothetical protein